MAELQLPGRRVAARVEGPDRAPPVLWIHSLGTSARLWDAQLEELSGLRHITYDLWGHGDSELPAGACSLAALGEEALAVLDAARAERAHVCGISIGGLVALWLAIHAPERVDRLVLANTAARIGTPEGWSQRVHDVRAGGLQSLVAPTLERWLLPATRLEQPGRAAALGTGLGKTSEEAYLGCCEVLRDTDLFRSLSSVSAPALVLVGSADLATTPADGDALARGIPGAELASLEAAHLSNVDRPAAFNARVGAFLVGASGAEADAARRSRGMRLRRRILGDAHVDRAQAQRTEFTRDFQDLITRYAWGEIWTRPGLEPRARRILVLGTLVALGRLDELQMHARAALESGDLSARELEEIVLQQAVYCGVPAGNAAFSALRDLVEAHVRDHGSGGGDR